MLVCLDGFILNSNVLLNASGCGNVIVLARQFSAHFLKKSWPVSSAGVPQQLPDMACWSEQLRRIPNGDFAFSYPSLANLSVDTSHSVNDPCAFGILRHV